MPSFTQALGAITHSLGAFTACTLLATVAAAALPTPARADTAGIAWQAAASDADVDAAFAQARQAQKPVFVYWGAKWCPPCNQLSATLFNRQDFIERSRAFVPVYVDGDRPGAQKLAGRFKVRGYPTMLLFDAQGTELTRLPGEVDAAQYTQVLTLGMNAQRPVKAVLADAQAGGAAAARLNANDWKLLAFYSWETDEQQVLPKNKLPATLRRLADACPPDQPETATRLLLKAVAATDAQAKPPAPPDPAARATLLQLLADPARARAHMDVLTNNAAELTQTLSVGGTTERALLVGAFNSALKQLAADTSLSRADRMMAVVARIELAKPATAKDGKGAKGAKPARPGVPPVVVPVVLPVVLPEALLAEVRDHTARADREITDGYERQAVITTAAYMLGRAGLLDESDALLKANLAKSHSPYYLMSSLAGNAKKRGDKTGALRWYEQAFEQSEGPATRLQWGAAYVGALVELAPQDETRIEQTVQRLLTEAGAQADAFYERSARSLQSMGKKLQSWNQGGAHAGALKRVQEKLDAVCSRLSSDDPQRATCDALLRPAVKKTAA
jgi:thioredoxin-related protein